MDPDIGFDKKAREEMADALAQVLADTYGLYQKTHSYHWNVTGPRFPQLHLMFEGQYNELWAALDTIAERIRALGLLTPGPAQIAQRSAIVADNGDASAEQMIVNLAKGHETLAKAARTALKKGEAIGDAASVDLLTQRIAASEKTAWMLRASAEG
ncbi:MAG TPA: DNA starvation/stationary phase protection protein [Caulobacterales bacterium]|jgi:starvation-inducible DNA-binding protein|nr:DNA starvation/stationary phase protection protein [Caulobacterales bacterium]